MNVYTNNEFQGHWPVGTAAIVVAESEMAASLALNTELLHRGLSATAKPEQFKRVDPTVSCVVVLNDGDY